jgi:hypothetical protein
MVRHRRFFGGSLGGWFGFVLRGGLHRFAVVAVVTATATAVPEIAEAQVVGSITGTVTDQTGMPLKGVRITGRSETQIGGAKSTYTDDQGFFRLPGLQPGIFEVTSASPGLRSVIQKQIRVGLNAPAEIFVIMEAQTKEEEVQVVERAPIISTTSAKVKETFDANFVDNLPLDKRTGYGGFIRDNVPGAADGGGVFAGSDWLARVRGANTNQNAVLVEGFRMDWHKITLNSLAAMEVLTAGNGAENAGTPGAVVNMVTQSGSNKYLLDVTAWHEDGRLRLFTTGNDTNNDRRQSFFNPTVSGPLIKDKLWFYLNTEFRNELIHRDPDPTAVVATPPPRYYWNTRGTLKLTWQVTPRNKIQSFTLINTEAWQNNREGWDANSEAQQMQDWQDYFTGVTWEALLADNLFFKSQFGTQRFFRTYKPESCRHEPDTCLETIPKQQLQPRSYGYGNYDRVNQLLDRSFEFVNTLEWFVQTGKLGEHSVKLTSRFLSRMYETTDGVPGDFKETFNGGLPDRRVEYFANDPRDAAGRHGYWIRSSSGFRFSNSISDVIRLTRHVTVTPGIGLTMNHADTPQRGTVIEQTALTPHVSAAWDATHDGRTVVRGSFNQYVDTDAVRIAQRAFGDGVSQDCRYNTATGAYDVACRYSGGMRGSTVGLPCGPQGLDERGQPCRESLSVPRTTEFTLGAERELVPGLGFGADLVRRTFSHPYEMAETNRIWNNAGTALVNGGSFRNGRAETTNDLETPDSAHRSYTGVTVSLKQKEGALRMTGSYTWSVLSGNVFLEEDNEYGDILARNVYLEGPSPYDRRHEVRASAVYQVNKWFSTGIVYNYYSGSPYSRKFLNQETGKFENYQSRVGTNPGTDVNDPADDRELRLPDIQKLNLQARAVLLPLLNINLEVFADVINVLGLRTPTAVYVEDGQLFGQPSARLDPFRVRLGLRYRY